MKWSSFKAKFDSKCRDCSCDMPTGSSVHGTKGFAVDGKWYVVCPSCYEKSYAETDESKKPSAKELSGIDSMSSDEAMKNLMGMFDETPDPAPASAVHDKAEEPGFDNIITRNKPWSMDWVKANANWSI